MSINWVMLKDEGKAFVPLPKERILHASPARTALAISTPNSYPGKEPLNITSSGGIAYITTQRVVYLPAVSMPHFQSFAAPILNLLDTRVTAPWFGANAWVSALKPVTGGGIPAQHAFVEFKLTFKDGGAYDFHQRFEEVKDRVSTAVETAQDSGRTADLTDVPFEQLPAYEPSAPSSSTAQQADHPDVVAPTPMRPPQSSRRADILAAPTASPVPSTGSRTQQGPPDEPPPGYEEAQSTGVMESVEESLRHANS